MLPFSSIFDWLVRLAPPFSFGLRSSLKENKTTLCQVFVYSVGVHYLVIVFSKLLFPVKRWFSEGWV